METFGDGWRWLTRRELARIAAPSHGAPLVGSDAERLALLATATGGPDVSVGEFVTQPGPPAARVPWSPPEPVSPQPFRPAVLRADFPDPSVVWGGDRWYAFATEGDGRNVQVSTSSDLAHWTPPSEALGEFPPWSMAGNTWAPSVARIGGQWVMYVSMLNVFGTRCIERLVSASPGGPYVTPPGIFGSIDCDATGGWGAIDPSPLVTGDGAYLYWKSDGPHPALFGAPLTPDGLGLAGQPVQLLAVGASWERGGVENPSMVPAEGSYWLFYSGAYWATANYATGLARCSGPLGPCRRVSDGTPWLGGRDGVVGPGGGSMFQVPDGHWRIAFHAWTGTVGYGKGGVRALHIEPVMFKGDGPSLSSLPPSGSLASLAVGPHGVAVTGTVDDPDTVESIEIVVTVNGAEVVDTGAAGGYSVVLPLTDGHHRICVTALDDVGRSATELGCGEVDVAPGATDDLPID